MASRIYKFLTISCLTWAVMSQGVPINENLPVPAGVSCSQVVPQWTEWSNWTPCSDACGGCGNRTRIKLCLPNIAPTCCPWPLIEGQRCNFNVCIHPRKPCCNNLIIGSRNKQIVCVVPA